MIPRRFGLIAVAASLVLFPSCRKKTVASPRIAVLLFENLTGDAAYDWTSRGASQLLALTLSTSGSLQVLPSGFRHKPEAVRAGANQIIYGNVSRAGGRLRLALWQEIAEAGKMALMMEETGPVTEGIIHLVDRAARRIAKDVGAVPTRQESALKAYVAGLESPDSSSASRWLQQAVEADPAFGAAYLRWMQLAASRNDRPEAEKVLEIAEARGIGLTPVDRARLALEAAGIRKDPAGRLRALRELAQRSPSDAMVARGLADAEFRAHQYKTAATLFEQAAKLNPSDDIALNLGGYAHAYAGNLELAAASLREYQKRKPGEANPLDSLGDVHYLLGRFADAERFYLEAFQKSPAFLAGGPLLKAARARLMTGDVTGADGLFAKYVDYHRAARDPVVDYRLAEWEFMTGRRESAIRRLAQFASAAESSQPLRETASRAYSHLAIWELSLGWNDKAAVHAGRASATAVSGQAAQMASLCRFLSEPRTSARDWVVRGERVFPDPQQTALKNYAVSYALVFSRHFSSAVPFFKQIYEQAEPTTQPDAAVTYGWTLMESGRSRDAAPLLERYPLPSGTGLETFQCLWFPRLLFLRAELAAKKGQKPAAERDYGLFLTLSGPTRMIFGEEQRAREALGQ